MVSGVGRPWEKQEERLTSLLIGRRDRVEQSLRYLPPDLAEQIIEAADQELARLEERRQTVKASLARLEDAIAEHKAETAAGSVTDERGAGVKSEAGAERSVELGRLTAWAAAHRQELSGLASKEGEARKVRRDAEAGVVSALLTVTSGWRGGGPGLFRLEGLRDVAVSVPSTSTGEPLPPEALDERGKADLPKDPRS